MSNVFKDCDTPTELLGQLGGAVSLCWNPAPTGVFDSEQANIFVKAALERLIEMGWASEPCRVCNGNGCENGCGRVGGCQHAYSGPDSHKICYACKGSGRHG